MNVNKANKANKANKHKSHFFDYALIIINTLILLFLILLISGCSQKEVVTKTEYIERTKLNLKNPEPIQLNNISYYVITDKNSQSFFDDIKKQGKQPVVFAIEPSDYENLSSNILKIKKYIIEEQQIIKTYKDYYEPEIK